jgi:hypothetical protein
MTADDFFLLLAAFGGFVVAPALLLWGFTLLAQRTRGGAGGPGIRPDIGMPDASRGDQRREAAPGHDQERQATIRLDCTGGGLILV